jgi:hypothetical protein
MPIVADNRVYGLGRREVSLIRLERLVNSTVFRDIVSRYTIFD